jgi:hypothetical protein
MTLTSLLIVDNLIMITWKRPVGTLRLPSGNFLQPVDLFNKGCLTVDLLGVFNCRFVKSV